jgi:hypothetical protein
MMIRSDSGAFAPEHLSGVKKAEQDGVKWSPEQAAAIQRFREFLDAEPESQPPPAS